MVAVGAASLAEYLLPVDLGIDQLLFRDPMPSAFPGRMAQFTAVAFVLTGLFLFPFQLRAREKSTDLLALAVGFLSAFAIVGYLYGVPIFYGTMRQTAMAIHTGLGFLLVATGFLFLPKEHGFARVFRAQTAGGMVARYLVPLGFFIPIMVGAAFLRFDFGQLRLALVVMCNVVLIVASVWGLARALDKSELERGIAVVASEMDVLTGIHNRRYFEQRLAEEIQRCVRHERDSSLILFDIDRFKSLNDRFGHPAGDTVLKTIAGACKKCIRTTDIICRFGGEEFAVIAPETTGKCAVVLAEKLRSVVALLVFDDVTVSATISLGIAQIGRTAATPEKAIAAADQALYAAKKLGRNCASLFNDVAISPGSNKGN